MFQREKSSPQLSGNASCSEPYMDHQLILISLHRVPLHPLLPNPHGKLHPPSHTSSPTQHSSNVDQPKNTFCTPEQSGVAALRSHCDSHLWKSPDWESGPNLPLLWITKQQEASASTSSFLPKGKSSTALLSLKSISCLRHSNKKAPLTAETSLKGYPAPAGARVMRFH